MINVTIKETGTQETLSYVDVATGIDCIRDFIGNYGAFHDGQFTLDEDEQTFICEQDTFNWWCKVVSDMQAVDERKQELVEKFGSDAVEDAIQHAGDVDLEDLAASLNKALDDVEIHEIEKELVRVSVDVDSIGSTDCVSVYAEGDGKVRLDDGSGRWVGTAFDALALLSELQDGAGWEAFWETFSNN